MTGFPLGSGALSGIASLTSHRSLSSQVSEKLSCQFQDRMDPMPVENCAFSSGMHTCGILSVGVPFLGAQHVKPAVILLMQYQSIPIPHSITKYQSGIGSMLCVPHSIQLVCQIGVIVCWEWIGSFVTMLVFWHVFLYPFLTVVNCFIHIFAWANCPCCYTIVHLHWLNFGSKIDIQVPY